jgi:hypothetical protein
MRQSPNQASVFAVFLDFEARCRLKGFHESDGWNPPPVVRYWRVARLGPGPAVARLPAMLKLGQLNFGTRTKF